MEPEPDKLGLQVAPPQPARFRPALLLAWLPACLACGAALAWVAVLAGSYFAPLLLFPLLVGAVTGAVVTALVRASQLGNRATILLGTGLAALTVVAGQHYFQYLAAYRPAPKDAQAFQTLMPAVVPSFPEYLQRIASRGRRINGRPLGGAAFAWSSWAVEGLLTLGAALAMTALASRQPYCNRCRSWYHLTRSGRLAPTCALELAQTLGVALPDKLVSARYRLAACNSGCGPSSFALYWEDADGAVSSQRLWLSAEQRSRLTELLDRQQRQAEKEDDEPPGADHGS